MNFARVVKKLAREVQKTFSALCVLKLLESEVQNPTTAKVQ